MNFCEKLKKLRKEKGLTQENLAEKLNVSRQAITKWESGYGIPDIENLKQISILFNTTIDELVKDDINIETKQQMNIVKELDIDHTKHFDIKIDRSYELNFKPIEEEKIKLELISKEELDQIVNIKFDDLYNRLDINIKSKKEIKDLCINMYIPDKYIDEIEIDSKIKKLDILNTNFKNLEYDGTLKYLNVENSKGNIILNTTKCDIQAKYDKLDGSLEINTINSTSRVELPKGSKYKTNLKGIKNQFVDANNTKDAKSTIELNGLNSKLIIIEK